MKRLFLVVSSLSLMVTAATAADLAARYTKAPTMAPGFNWNGFYVGGNVGYAWEDPTVTTTPNDAGSVGFTTLTPPLSFGISGPVGGFQAGYNWTVNSPWLLGVEADFNFSDIRGRASVPSVLFETSLNYIADEQIKWFGTVRGRIGYLASPNLLLFGTGGFAYGRVNQHVSLSLVPGQTSGFSSGDGPDVFCEPSLQTECFRGNSGRMAVGWAAGAGAEYVIGANWTAKIEYLYVNLGSNNFISNALVTQLGPSSSTIRYSDTTFQTVRAGLNFHF